MSQLADGGPLGTVRGQFSPPNESGVIDHEVAMPDGMIVYNCLRVAPNGDGADVLFTLLRQPGMDDAAFEADARDVQRDLKTLRALMEDDKGQRVQ